jgi:carboxylate-amine ligase
MHVHVEIADDDMRIDLFNQLTYFLPHLLALSTSSPFWRGHKTGLKSYRLSVFNELPRTGLPQQFDSASEYDRTIGILVKAGVIEDATKVWWDLRPSARFPTIEMRISDVATRVEDTLTIAALYRCITRMLWRLRRGNQRWRQYSGFLVAENRWQAQRHGTSGELVDFGIGECVPFAELIEELIDLTREDAEYFDCVAEVERARDIVRDGTSADRQLEIFDKVVASGASQTEAFQSVVDFLVSETRRDC